MLRFPVSFYALACLLLTPSASPADPASDEAEARAKWQEDIAALKQLDVDLEPDPDSILFLGSSSIRLWDSIEEDMAPYTVLRRGYGGARFFDLRFFAAELVEAHEYQSLVLFVGNDIKGAPEDASVEDAVSWFLQVVTDSRAHQPQARVFCIGVTPTWKRWDTWPRVVELNKALQKACEQDKELHFIATAEAFLDENGEPRAEFFIEDELHLNEGGYDRWADIIKEHLERASVTP